MLVRDEMVRNGEEPSVDSARVSDTKAFNKKGCIKDTAFFLFRELNSPWICSKTLSTLFNLSGWLTSQSLCGDKRIRAPFAPPLLSDPLNVLAEDQAVATSSLIDNPELKIFFLSFYYSKNQVFLDNHFLKILFLQ